MKFCDRCYVEYEDDEIVQFDKESPKWICLPCKWEFDHRLKTFLIEFFNDQPERSKREDSITEVRTDVSYLPRVKYDKDLLTKKN